MLHAVVSRQPPWPRQPATKVVPLEQTDTGPGSYSFGGKLRAARDFACFSLFLRLSSSKNISVVANTTAAVAKEATARMSASPPVARLPTICWQAWPHWKALPQFATLRFLALVLACKWLGNAGGGAEGGAAGEGAAGEETNSSQLGRGSETKPASTSSCWFECEETIKKE